MSAASRKIEAARRLAASTDVPGEREAAEAAISRLEASSPTRDVVRKREPLTAGPRPARLLMPHQRKAWLALAAGGGRLSRNENSFLHRMRESSHISPAQQRWLDDIDVRLQWEATL